MLSDYTRKSVGSVIRAPDPENEFYVFVARYWPSNYEPGIGEEECVFDRWDLELAPSPSLIGEYDEETTVWSEWARQYVAEIGEDTILHRAATHAEDAGDRDVVFVCYEPDSARPRCHTFTILSVLEGQQQTALDDFLQRAATDEGEGEDAIGGSDEETCPNGYEWCPGPDGDTLPCFGCFDPANDYE